MRNLFKNLKDIDYVIGDKKYIVKDIYNFGDRIKAIEKYKNSTDYYYIYQIKDGDKWETIARNFYGNTAMSMFWIFIVMNDIDDLFFGFPLTIDELSSATHYSDEEKRITQTLFETTVESNDALRYIKILKKEYIPAFESAFFT